MSETPLLPCVPGMPTPLLIAGGLTEAPVLETAREAIGNPKPAWRGRPDCAGQPVAVGRCVTAYVAEAEAAAERGGAEPGDRAAARECASRSAG